MKTSVQSKKNGVQNGVNGIVRLDLRTKNLVKRLKPGEIAVIDHVDIDRVSAESLIECRPSLIINASCSVTGNYPNLGPLMIAASGIPILDEVGERVFDILSDGDAIEVIGNAIYHDGELVSKGCMLTLREIELRVESSKRRLGRHLGDFAANTLELLETEKEILLESVDLPGIKTRFSGRHALVVVRGHDHKSDLRSLKPYMRETRPVLVAVDGGADALLERGYQPDMIVGDMDSVSDEALKSGAELVVHGYADGRAPGKKRLEELELPYTVFHYMGTSEDIAMLVAFEKGSELIALVGGHNSLVEFLDKDRKGMASTFLVRLRVGTALVDAKGISQLYQARAKAWHLALVVIVALLVMVIVILLSEPVRQLISVLALRFEVWLMRLQNLF